MGAGARLAEERDRWGGHWLVVDLEMEGEHLLELLGPGEELRAAVPGFRDAWPHGEDPVLIGVTDRRVLVIGRRATPGGEQLAIEDVTQAVTALVAAETLTGVVLGIDGGTVTLDQADLARLREYVAGPGSVAGVG